MRWLAAAALAFCTGALALSNEVDLKDLPREARQMVLLVKAGGPFQHSHDGKPFQNREKLLPRHERGYYREYTVRTPGAPDRGARRIVAGRNGEYYYTDDHDRSFKRILE